MITQLVEKVRGFVVTPCLEEGESYSSRARKMFVIAVAMIASNALLLGIPVTILDALHGATTGTYILGAFYVQVTITTAIFPYLYIRLTQRIPDWVCTVQLWSTLPIATSFCLFTHQGSITIVCAVVACMSVVMRVRGWPVMLLYFISISVLHALINDYAEELPALHETFYHTQILPTKILYLLGANVSPLVCFGGGLFIIMSDFAQRMDQADAAIAMNLAVADKLRRYDTDGIAEILAANHGKVDENLLEAFAAIQYNLQEYRPHIPDYVIEATMADLSDDDDDGFGESVVMQAGDSMLQGVGVDDDDEGDHSLSLSGSQQSRFPSNHNASFLGSYSSPGTPGVVSQNSSHRPTSSSLKMGRNSPIIGATATSSSREGGGGKTPHHLPNTSPHSSVTDVSFMKSSSLIATHSVPTTLPDPAGIPPTTEVATVVGRTSSSSYMWGGQAPVSRQVHDTQTRHEVSQKYAPDTSMAKSTQSRDTNVSDVSGGGLAASRISSNGRGGGGKRAGKQQGGASKTYTGRATTVFIRFVAVACGSTRGTDGAIPRGSHVPTVVEHLGLGVEAVSKLAKAHGGALQYMQGCGLMVSFNAASRVLAHEAKACAFALGLKAEIEGLRRGPLVLHATIVTTPILSFFAGNKGQLVLTVLGGYMPIHTALHHYLSQTVGDDVSCVLVSKSTMPNVELHYEARMLGVVGMSSRGQEGGEHVGSISVQSDAIQLLCSRKATESDEWMYELENQTSTHGFTKKIVDTAASGDLLGAMRIVSEHETAIHDDTLLSRCLHDRIESCIEDSTAFPLHTAPPTKMW